MSFVALFGFFLVGTFITIAVSSSRYFLSPACSLRDRATFIWIAFDGLTHVVLEGGFLWYSIQGRTCNNSNALLAQICKFQSSHLYKKLSQSRHHLQGKNTPKRMRDGVMQTLTWWQWNSLLSLVVEY